MRKHGVEVHRFPAVSQFLHDQEPFIEEEPVSGLHDVFYDDALILMILSKTRDIEHGCARALCRRIDLWHLPKMQLCLLFAALAFGQGVISAFWTGNQYVCAWVAAQVAV